MSEFERMWEDALRSFNIEGLAALRRLIEAEMKRRRKPSLVEARR